MTIETNPLGRVRAALDAGRTGAELYRVVSDLYPICRSITGEGFRQTLRRLQQFVPLTLQEVPSGTPVFDWVVPNEWNIRDAYIKNRQGERVVDFQKSNLHVVNYSVPVRGTYSLQELRARLHSLPEHPDWIPYRTSYYREDWGFCLAHRQLEALADGKYEVCIDSTLQPGHLTYGEFFLRGATADEVLVSCHACHPSLCNDNLSGIVVAAELARLLAGIAPRYSYRFLWIPGTIGAITWLALNEATLPRIKHGLVLSCVGDPGPFTYKRSRRGTAPVDRVVEYVLRQSARAFEFLNFTPYGYDERQYCSPGINLPVGCFMRTPNGKYAQYHTSADDLSFVTAPALAESLGCLLRIVEVLERDGRYVNLFPKCEPQLGRRGLYRQMGGTSSSGLEEAMLWMLNFSDGAHSLLDIAEQSGLDFDRLCAAADVLLAHKLLALQG
jgi:aminopeptidase-like protein